MRDTGCCAGRCVTPLRIIHRIVLTIVYTITQPAENKISNYA
jgi:hypothetical protein